MVTLELNIIEFGSVASLRGEVDRYDSEQTHHSLHQDVPW
jgi:hypothetical protein